METLDPDTFHRNKILLGLNFYGMRYTAEGGMHVIGAQFVDFLRQVPASAKFSWDKDSAEHFLDAKLKGGSRHTVFFPSLNSIQTRLHLAKELGTGVSIWELGQGLDYFFDLL